MALTDDRLRVPVHFQGRIVAEAIPLTGGPSIYIIDTPFAPILKEDVESKGRLTNYIKGRLEAGESSIHLDRLVGSGPPAYEAAMREVRTTSATGGEKGVKPQRYSLIPRQALDAVSEVFDFGTKKYPAHNWRKGYEWSKSYDALQRHLTLWWDREENDPESGLSHLAHAAWHVLVLLTYSRDARYAEYDDRYAKDK